VPKATVNVDCHARWPEHQVSGARKLGQRAPMNPETQSASMERSPKSKLDRRVAGALALHPQLHRARNRNRPWIGFANRRFRAHSSFPSVPSDI
jgi:hypothetical protein